MEDEYEEVKNFGQISLSLDEDGQLNGSIRWRVDPETDPEHGRYLVEALHGMFSVLMNDPEYTVDLGAAYLLGAVSKEIEEDGDIEFSSGESLDNEEETGQDDLDLTGKILSFTPSNRKH